MPTADQIPDLEPNPPDTRQFRHHMGQVSKHSTVYFAGTIFTAAAGYLFKVYLARFLGARELGLYALGMTIVGLVGVFNALGLPQTALRFVASYSATGRLDSLRGFLARSILTLLSANFILAAFMLLAGPWIAARFYHAPELMPYMGLFTVLMFLGVLTMFFSHVLGGYKDVAQRTVVNNFVGNPATMVLTFALVAMGLGLRGYLFAQIGATILVLILLVTLVWKRTPPRVRSLRRGIPAFESEAISFSRAAMGMAILGYFISHSDRVIVGHYLQARDLGIYTVASAVVAFVPIVLSSVNQIFAPTISDLHSRQQHKLLAQMFQTLTKWIIGLTLPLAATIMIFSMPLMRIFGRDFEAGWPILVIGALGQLVNCGVGSSGMMVFMSGHQRLLVKIQMFVAAFTLVLNLLLVPMWGIIGAAVSAAATNAIANLGYLAAVRRTLGVLPYNRGHLRLLLPLGGTLGLLFLVKKSLLHSVGPEWLVVGISLMLGYAVFVGLALAVGLDADDRVIAEAAWARMRAVFQRLEIHV